MKKLVFGAAVVVDVVLVGIGVAIYLNTQDIRAVVALSFLGSFAIIGALLYSKLT